MKVGTIGGGLVVGMLVAVVLTGLRSQEGQDIVDPLGDAGQAAGRSWGHTLSDTLGVSKIAALAGNPWAAVGVAALLALVVILLVPGANTSRGRPVALAVGALLGAVVYRPELVGA